VQVIRRVNLPNRVQVVVALGLVRGDIVIILILRVGTAGGENLLEPSSWVIAEGVIVTRASKVKARLLPLRIVQVLDILVSKRAAQVLPVKDEPARLVIL